MSDRESSWDRRNRQSSPVKPYPPSNFDASAFKKQMHLENSGFSEGYILMVYILC